MSSNPENMYEIPKNPADKEAVKRLQRNVFIGFVFLVIFAIIALAAVGIAVYAVTKDSDSKSGSACSEIKCENGGNNGLSTGTPPAAGSACNQVTCENGGSCINIPPNDYICACVATFYGRNCQHGEFYISDIHGYWGVGIQPTTKPKLSNMTGKSQTYHL